MGIWCRSGCFGLMSKCLPYLFAVSLYIRQLGVVLKDVRTIGSRRVANVLLDIPKQQVGRFRSSNYEIWVLRCSR